MCEHGFVEEDGFLRLTWGVGSDEGVPKEGVGAVDTGEKEAGVVERGGVRAGEGGEEGDEAGEGMVVVEAMEDDLGMDLERLFEGSA